MVEEIEGIYPELHLNPFGYIEVLRQPQVHRASGWPEAVANPRGPNRAQLEPVHGVPIRVNPLEVLKAGVPAGLTRHAGRVVDIRYAIDNWRIGGPSRKDDDRGDSPRTQAGPDDLIHVLQGRQVVEHVG